MQAPSPVTDIVRFGVFQLDLKARELFKAGVKIKLQEQPFRVLALLVTRAGQVVTREELQQTVWPTDVYVAFDQGLNNAIKKVRDALGDSADSPRFIETVARHGYRFVAPIGAAPVLAPVPRSRFNLGTVRNVYRRDCRFAAHGFRILVVARLGHARQGPFGEGDPGGSAI